MTMYKLFIDVCLVYGSPLRGIFAKWVYISKRECTAQKPLALIAANLGFIPILHMVPLEPPVIIPEDRAKSQS